MERATSEVCYDFDHIRIPEVLVIGDSVQEQPRKRMEKRKKASKRPLLAFILNRLNLYGQVAYRFEY